MDRISQHLDQTNGLDCDMGYVQQQQLVAPTQTMRFDQEQQQQQLFHQKHQQQNAITASQDYGQRAAVSAVNQCAPIIYHQQTKHVYEEYPQQVLSLDNSHHHSNRQQPLYMQQQPQFMGGASSMYQATPGNRHLQQQQQTMMAYEPQPDYTAQQVQYIPQITQVQMIEPDPQYSHMLSRPAMTTRHHQQNQQHQLQQYQYNSLVMQPQPQQLPPPPALAPHPLQQPPLPLPLPMPPPALPQQQRIHQHQHPHLQQQQQNQNSFDQHIQLMSEYQQPTIAGVHPNDAQFAGEVPDNQTYYQELMDLLPTIKQQEQQAAEASLIQDRSMPITIVAREVVHQQQQPQLNTINVGPYREAPICTDQLLPQQQQPSVVDPEATLLLSQQQQHSYTQQPTTQQHTSHQLQQQPVSRPKSDLNSQVDIKNTFEFTPASEPHIRSQDRSQSSTISYVDQQQQLQQQARSLGVQPEQNDRKQQHHQEFVDMRSSGSISQDWLDTICGHLIDHMNRYGICVIDNFLGRTKGDSILNEVKQLYSGGRYTKGRLVNSDKLASRNLAEDIGTIRNDHVIWIDGCEDGCSEINNLIQILCSVITNSSRLSLYSNNGLDKVVIKKRTKAHVACYPGNGTRYIKHVDNPNGDGRVITSIYYLNKDWNTKHDGGLLRMFPAGMNEVANIEPIFDRALFFWSDRRNPHEVLPAYKDRFAITVWYIGENRP